jgi:hypothetical protein
MGKREHIFAPRIRFLSEQDGVPERELKKELVVLFAGFDTVIRAYLVRVDYGNPNEFNVALCLRTHSEPPPELNDGISEIFSNIFRTDEHLDVLILTEEMERDMGGVCCPFFNQSAS